jgi:hypothetical protein
MPAHLACIDSRLALIRSRYRPWRGGTDTRDRLVTPNL